MTKDQLILWERIKDFELDEPTTSLTFTDRLARENGWSIEYTVRTVHEYKKFMFMLCVAEHSLTPSDQVDQVWHLHMLYTQSYWKDFCQETLNKEIHHGPTKGGTEEGEKYDNLYGKTIDLYKRLFDKDAPVEIWPTKEIRFGEINFQRVSLDRNWVIRKPKFLRR
jgi:hypothetical protein